MSAVATDDPDASSTQVADRIDADTHSPQRTANLPLRSSADAYFASRALALGEGLPIIGRLLHHRRVETTARYAHLARDLVRESAERIAASIAKGIL